MTTPLVHELATTPPPAEGLRDAERRRHAHIRGCWWNHLEARWICCAAHAD
jgi:hypothetical protein